MTADSLVLVPRGMDAHIEKTCEYLARCGSASEIKRMLAGRGLALTPIASRPPVGEEVEARISDCIEGFLGEECRATARVMARAIIAMLEGR